MSIEVPGISMTPEEERKMQAQIEAVKREGRDSQLLEDEAREKLKKADARIYNDAGERMIGQEKVAIEAALKEDSDFVKKVFEEVEGEDKDI